jgi:GST-like protein
MIRFYFHPTPNPAKVALMLEETGLVYQVVPIDTSKGEQHKPEFRAINPNGKVPAIVDTEGPGGKEELLEFRAILLYLGEKTGRLMGSPADKPELLSGCSLLRPTSGRSRGRLCISSMLLPKAGFAINRYAGGSSATTRCLIAI